MESTEDNDFEYSSLITDPNDDTSSQYSEPEDKLGFVKLTFGLLGLSQLIPWNFLITANDYWNYKFRRIPSNQSLEEFQVTSGSEMTSLQKYFESYLSIATNLPFLLVLTLNAVYGQRIPDKLKNFWSFIAIVVVFIITTSFVKIDTDSYQNNFFGLTIGSIVLVSISAAFLQSSISGIASLFPPECMHAMVTGQAVSGLFAALAQILSLLGQLSATKTAFYYFLTADITLILSLIMFSLINTNEYYRYHKQRVNENRQQMLSFPDNSGQNDFRAIVQKLWPHMLSAMLVFGVTLSVFPAITVLVVPVHTTSDLVHKLFIPTACFLLFNFSDLMGRFAGKFCPIPSHRRYLLLASAVSRIVFVPLIMACNAMPETRTYLPVLFESEIWFITFVTLLGFTNGYVLINIMVNGPTAVADDSKERAGFYLVCMIGLGLALGSALSTFLLRLL